MNRPAHERHQEAMRCALRLLRSRDRTESEVRQGLSAKGFSEEEADLALASLKRSRFVDDARVASRTVEVAKTGRPKGRLRIEQELEARGVSQDATEQALASLLPSSEPERAEVALRARIKPGDSPQKSARYLARLGFDEDTVAEVVGRIHEDVD